MQNFLKNGNYINNVLNPHSIAISEVAHRLFCPEFLAMPLPATQAMIQVYWLTAHNLDQADYSST